LNLPENKSQLGHAEKIDSAVSRQPQLCYSKARELEESGDYEGARRALSPFWSQIGTRPLVDGLALHDRAEIILRAGVLSGWIGSAQQIPGAQQIAKDLIGESIGLFETEGDSERAVNAQIDLAICYWREGALDEARVMLQDVRERAKGNLQIMARALLNSCVVEVSASMYREAYQYLKEAAPLYEQVENHIARGRYHMQRALVLRHLGATEGRPDDIDQALIDYAVASYHYEQAGNVRYQAGVENNVGYLLFTLGRFPEAQQHLERARRLYLTMKDIGRVAQVNEAFARLYLAQGQYVAAERAASGAIFTLERGDEHSLLAEALITHATALARLGQDARSRQSFARAATISETAGDKGSAVNAHLTTIEELNTKLSGPELMDIYQRADQMLGDAADSSILSRLRSCSSIALNGLLKYCQSGNFRLEDFLIGGTLDEEVLHFEGELIRRALQQEQGSITRAARLLGTTHQGLAFIINGRQRQLLAERQPPRARRRSIITKPQKKKQR
jgi:tetratricopeptide (TPR) repeat protein